ncbi:hypothetical protein [Methylorubrum populi]|uniref:Uncharacterized protein n=1 Tax=Methylorubrum populi TaxID=223967 RepID=A0A921E3C5_9HYPH|nr:hypothetical protein [Methylorubrum populi]
MNILARLGSSVASAAVRLGRLAPRLIPLAVVSMIGLSAGQAAGQDLDGDGDETARSIVYRHYV